MFAARDGLLLDPGASLGTYSSWHTRKQLFISKCFSVYPATLIVFQEPSHVLLAYLTPRGPGSSLGIATDYGQDGPGSNPGGDEISRPSRPALGPTQPPVKWVPGLSRGYRRPGGGAEPLTPI